MMNEQKFGFTSPTNVTFTMTFKEVSLGQVGRAFAPDDSHEGAIARGLMSGFRKAGVK